MATETSALNPVEGSVIENLDIASIKGISQVEADRRLAAEGFNEIPSSSRRNFFIMALDVMREPMFLLLIVANLGLIMTNRSWSQTIFTTLRSPNAALWWLLGGVAIFLALVLYVPSLRGLFKFEMLHANDVLLCLSAGLLSIAWFELVKCFRRVPTQIIIYSAPGPKLYISTLEANPA